MTWEMLAAPGQLAVVFVGITSLIYLAIFDSAEYERQPRNGIED